MGMFDKPQYLTGKGDNAYVSEGDVFWLHNARIEGETNIGGNTRTLVKLKVSHERDGETAIVFTSGLGIVNQIRRMTADDRAAMPIEIRLDAIPSTKPGHNPTHVLTPAGEPAPEATAATDDDIPF
jgi:hypothetical protein